MISTLTATLPSDAMVDKTLVDIQQDCVSVRVANLSGEPRKICRGVEGAGWELVESIIQHSCKSSIKLREVSASLLEHLTDLYVRSDKGLNDEQQHEVRELLTEFFKPSSHEDPMT